MPDEIATAEVVIDNTSEHGGARVVVPGLKIGFVRGTCDTPMPGDRICRLHRALPLALMSGLS